MNGQVVSGQSIGIVCGASVPVLRARGRDHVLEHLDDDATALARAARLLKPG